jgi:hypothetical protein
MGFELEIELIDHLRNSQLITTNNYSAIFNPHILKMTRAHTVFFSLQCLHKSFPGNGY